MGQVMCIPFFSRNWMKKQKMLLLHTSNGWHIVSQEGVENTQRMIGSRFSIIPRVDGNSKDIFL